MLPLFLSSNRAALLVAQARTQQASSLASRSLNLHDVCAFAATPFASLADLARCVHSFFLTLLGAALHTANNPLQYKYLSDLCAELTASKGNSRLTFDVCYNYAPAARPYAAREYALLALAWVAFLVAAFMLGLVGLVGWRFRKAGVKMESDSAHAGIIERGDAPATTTTTNNVAASKPEDTSPEGEASCPIHADATHGSTSVHKAGVASKQSTISPATAPASAHAQEQSELSTHVHVKSSLDAPHEGGPQLPAYTVDAPAHHGVATVDAPAHHGVS